MHEPGRDHTAKDTARSAGKKLFKSHGHVM